MVWKVLTRPARPSSEPIGQKFSDPHHPGEKMDTDRDQSEGHLLCEEHFPSFPGCPTSDSHMEYDDLPALQEVQEKNPTAAPVYQVEVGVSHHQREGHTHPGPPDTHWLTQLAHIATGPQSPLLQESLQRSPPPARVYGTGCSLHSYARPPPAPPAATSLPAPSTAHGRERRRSRRISESGSAVSTRSSLSDEEDMGWRHSWPPTAWHCFLKGTRLRFHAGGNVEWQDADDVGSADDEEASSLTVYGLEGLRLVEHAEVVHSDQSVLQLTFDPGACGQSSLTAQCSLDHPFYVRHKGWSSFYPSLTVMHYGIPCYEVLMGDVCLPPGHKDAEHTDDSLVFDTFRSYDFTPLDSSAVYVLSSMARRRRTSQSSGGAVSPDRELQQDTQSPGPAHSSRRKPIESQPNSPPGSNGATKCKRPMNAFMLFAKKFRVEYTQMHPGKDNRAISVLLGERWKKLRGEERRVYTMEAKALADQQKRLNPDCWKRKRTNSGCQGN